MNAIFAEADVPAKWSGFVQKNAIFFKQTGD
jgi:hypothetical protein